MAKDLFSKQASLYARYRPGYPPELFDYILSFVKGRKAVWDCATGNGQAAVAIAPFFEKVYATDISEKQLQQAVSGNNIEYGVASEDTTTLPDSSVDLITVAQAYHWFNAEGFREEAVRVAREGAIVAIWGYSLVVCDDERVNELLKLFYRLNVGPYWDKERKYVDDHYTTVSFPFHELPAKDFRIQAQWKKEDLMGYLNTWSSVQHFMKANQYNPVDDFATETENVWVDNSVKAFYFPLFLRLGEVK
jgi:ubiquinone/menaquinone biosynthesis C-methylase UbiE